ncbi:MAG TPA: WD40 repeat domain-containing protein [Abditibacteriaceae bacterium]|jgi:WD40 repeat protein
MWKTKAIRKQWIKIAALATLLVAFYFYLRSQLSWRPRVLRHNSFVHDVAFSPDGRRITTAQHNGTMLDWNVATKQPTRVVQLPRYYKSSPSWQVFSPDGSLLAACTEDCSVRLWNVSTGKFLHVFVQSRTEKYVPSVTFSPDNKTIVTTSWRTPMKLWDVASGKQKVNFANSSIKASLTAFSPDGQVLATTRSDKTIKLWSVATGKLLRILTPKRTINDVLFSPDGTLLAAGSEADGGAQPGEVMVWNTKTWQQRVLRGHGDSGPMIMLAFSSDSRTLVSTAPGLSRSSVKFWNVSTGELVREIAADGFSIKFSPDNSVLATGSESGQVKLWRIK